MLFLDRIRFLSFDVDPGARIITRIEQVTQFVWQVQRLPLDNRETASPLLFFFGVHVSNALDVRDRNVPSWGNKSFGNNRMENTNGKPCFHPTENGPDPLPLVYFIRKPTQCTYNTSRQAQRTYKRDYIQSST